MIDLMRRKSGKKQVIFIIDEVGQYASAKQSLILNLDGLAKNLKQVGAGHVWLLATAQQTLTEDSPMAMLNAPGLYKLKDRFPIQINLEASDIKEICHKRLLTKSAQGEEVLGQKYDTYGASLRTATQLKDGGVYDVPLDRRTFLNLYPFLPQHFEILLQLLGRLARRRVGWACDPRSRWSRTSLWTAVGECLASWSWRTHLSARWRTRSRYSTLCGATSRAATRTSSTA